jgi:hypothetical protein
LQSLTYLVYGFSIAFLLFRYRFTVARTDYLLAALGVLALAGSGALDVAMPLVPIQRLEDPWLRSIYSGAEELLKLTGILFWLTYLVKTGFISVSNALAHVNAE